MARGGRWGTPHGSWRWRPRRGWPWCARRLLQKGWEKGYQLYTWLVTHRPMGTPTAARIPQRDAPIIRPIPQPQSRPRYCFLFRRDIQHDLRGPGRMSSPPIPSCSIPVPSADRKNGKTIVPGVTFKWICWWLCRSHVKCWSLTDVLAPPSLPGDQ